MAEQHPETSLDLKQSTIDKTKLREEYDSLHWIQKVDERIELDDLVKCVDTMNAFYSKTARVYERVIQTKTNTAQGA